MVGLQPVPRSMFLVSPAWKLEVSTAEGESMKSVRLTLAQALVRYLIAQHTERDGCTLSDG